MGQFCKSQRMFSLKAFNDGNKLFVKSTILKSFSPKITWTDTLSQMITNFSYLLLIFGALKTLR